MKVSIATLVLAVLLTTTAVQTDTARGSTDSITVELCFNETDLSYKKYSAPDNTKYDIDMLARSIKKVVDMFS